ncbi:MAG TPA: hypothetical protein PKM88_06800, partial [bacterium]|nr:hypothetical protein [bacterium]
MCAGAEADWLTRGRDALLLTAAGIISAGWCAAGSGLWVWPGALLLALWLNLLALALGLAAGRRLLVGQPAALRWSGAAALGWGLLALLVLAAGLVARVQWLPAISAVLAFLMFGAGTAWRALLADVPVCWRAAASAPLARWGRWGVLLALAPAALLLSPPPVTYDAMTYHLALPQHYLNTGGIGALPWNHYSGFPQTVELLFLLALALGGYGAVPMVAFSLGVWLLVALWGLARSCCRLSPAAAWLALLLALTVPEIWDGFSVAMIDVPAALFMVLAAAFLFGRTPRELVAAAVFTGLAMGCK